MGMLACYMELTPEQTELLCAAARQEGDGRQEGGAFAFLEEQEMAEAGTLCQLDKLWDGVHCLLTGRRSDTPEKVLYDKAVFGSEVLFTEPGMLIAYSTPEQVAAIRDALDAFDLESALENFDPLQFHALEVYPNIWVQEDASQLREELRMYVEELRRFYRQMAGKGRAVAASIY